MKRIVVIACLTFTAVAAWRYVLLAVAKSPPCSRTLAIDCSSTRGLSFFGKSRAREALLRHLSASTDWRVTASWQRVGPQEELERVFEATRRPTRILASGNRIQHRSYSLTVVLRFASSPPSNWCTESYALAGAGDEDVNVPLLPTPHQSGSFGSTLIVQGDSVLLRIVEHSRSPQRWLTKKALREVGEELVAVSGNVEVIMRDGYLKKLTPTRSIDDSAGGAALEIEEGPTRGVYWVSGYVNEGEKGYISLRTFHARTGKELDANVNSWRTAEYVGWSAAPSERFFFGCQLEAPRYLEEEESRMNATDPPRFQALPVEQRIRVEAWFHGNEERKVLETTKVLVPWMR